MYISPVSFTSNFLNWPSRPSKKQHETAQKYADMVLAEGRPTALETVGLINKALLDAKNLDIKRQKIAKLARDTEDGLNFTVPLEETVKDLNHTTLSTIRDWLKGGEGVQDKEGRTFKADAIYNFVKADFPEQINITKDGREGFVNIHKNADVAYFFNDIRFDDKHPSLEIVSNLKTNEITALRMSEHWMKLGTRYFFKEGKPYTAVQTTPDFVATYDFNENGEIQTVRYEENIPEGTSKKPSGKVEVFEKDANGDFQYILTENAVHE